MTLKMHHRCENWGKLEEGVIGSPLKSNRLVPAPGSRSSSPKHHRNPFITSEIFRAHTHTHIESEENITCSAEVRQEAQLPL